MPTKDLGDLSINDRLNCLEEENRRLRRRQHHLTLIFVLTIGFLFLIGANSYKNIPAFERITVQQISLVDGTGTVRGTIGIDAQGAIAQSFFDSNGTERTRIAVEADDVARMRLFGEKGGPRVSMSTFPANINLSNFAGLTLYEEDGETPRITMGVDSETGAAQHFYDTDGLTRVKLATDEQGWGYQLLFDRQGTPRIQLATTPQDEGYQIFFDASQAPLIKTTTISNTLGHQSFYDSQGQPRIVMMTNQAGFGMQLSYDKDGKLRSELTTYPSSDLVQAFYSQTEETKASTIVAKDGTFAFYTEKGALEQGWDVLQTILTVKDLYDLTQENSK